jgi:lipooligosaccharide transport system permease protein
MAEPIMDEQVGSRRASGAGPAASAAVPGGSVVERALRRISAPLALRSLGYWAYRYRRTWRASVISTVLTPVLFLAAMGVGLGALVDSSPGGGVHGVGYLAFLAPGLLAAAAMQTGVAESTYPVLASIKWIKTYHAMLATPLGPVDVLVGHLLWIAIRVLTGSVVYLAVIALFGATRSPLAVLAIPAAVLTGMAFCTPVVAFAAGMDNEGGFAALFRFVVTPMFLFSGTFFPVTQLPPVLEQLAYGTPLWHGVDLCRSLTLGTATAGMTLLHIAYLGCWLIGGALAAAAVFRRRLVV